MNPNNALPQPRAAFDTLLGIGAPTAVQAPKDTSTPKDRPFDSHMADQAEHKAKSKNQREPVSERQPPRERQDSTDTATTESVDSSKAEPVTAAETNTKPDDQAPEKTTTDSGEAAPAETATGTVSEAAVEGHVAASGLLNVENADAKAATAVPLNGGVLGSGRKTEAPVAAASATEAGKLSGNSLPATGVTAPGLINPAVVNPIVTETNPAATGPTTSTEQLGQFVKQLKAGSFAADSGVADTGGKANTLTETGAELGTKQDAAKAAPALTTQLSMAAGKSPVVAETTLLAQAVTAAVDKVAANGAVPADKADLSAIKATAAPRLIAPNVTKYQMEGQPAVTQTRVNVPVGQPQWPSAVAEKVMWMSSQRVTAAEIHLDPPELGPLQVRVTVNQEAASVTFASQHSAVREALDQGAFRLREMFDAEGLDLTNVDVSDQSLSQGAEEGEGSANGGGGSGANGEESEEVVSTTAISSHDGLVDHYV